MTFDSVLTIALTALISGGSNALGIWLVSRHLISRIDKNGKSEAKND